LVHDMSNAKEILYVFASAQAANTWYITFASPSCTFAELLTEIHWNHPNLKKFILKVETPTKSKSYATSTHAKIQVGQLSLHEYFVLDFRPK